MMPWERTFFLLFGTKVVKSRDIRPIRGQKTRIFKHFSLKYLAGTKICRTFAPANHHREVLKAVIHARLVHSSIG